jgi:hypothetical protein
MERDVKLFCVINLQQTFLERENKNSPVVVTTQKNAENKQHAKNVVITVHFLPITFRAMGIETTTSISRPAP